MMVPWYGSFLKTCHTGENKSDTIASPLCIAQRWSKTQPTTGKHPGKAGGELCAVLFTAIITFVPVFPPNTWNTELKRWGL